CYVDDKVSKVAWLNRSNIIFAGQDKWSLDPRVDLVTKGQLEYSLRIQKVDVYDEGSYTCSIQTKQQPKTSQVYLIVQVPANIYKVSEDIIVNEGSNVTLSCLASGRPDPAITWRLLNPSAEPLEGEEYLDIIGIVRNQAGRYECKASNDVATPDVKYVNVVVNCELINAQGINIQILGTTTILMIANVTEEDYGNYTCVATNRLGVQNASVFLYTDTESVSYLLPHMPTALAPFKLPFLTVPQHRKAKLKVNGNCAYTAPFQSSDRSRLPLAAMQVANCSSVWVLVTHIHTLTAFWSYLWFSTPQNISTCRPDPLYLLNHRRPRNICCDTDHYKPQRSSL
ncbi:Limbic system-associated membrane protein, partial [Nibea albiflora]